MVDAAVTAFGKLDILIANAGILRDKSFKNMTDDMWDVVMDVHLRGTYLTTKVAFDRMLEQGTGGRIIMTSSTSGLLGNFGQTNYGAAKAGIAGFMRCLWLEGVKYGITVNVLAPTATSRLTTDILPEEVQDSFPPEAVSPPVVWLCTDEAKDISGRQWLVAGNNVSLLSWQVTPIAQASADAEPWAVADIGEKILASKEDWPPVNPLRGG
jgi:NAD(P)-dependent dehydrogenase (short-subunit alcohol dehydrogenase family)